MPTLTPGSRPVLVDPARHRGFEFYRGASLLKPNRVEAEQGSGLCIHTIQEAAEAATRLRSRYSIESVVVTLDRQGLVWAAGERTEHVPARPREVYDITGAGDMSLAALGFAIGKGEPLSTAAPFANFAAGLEVERQGVAPVAWSDLVAACMPAQRSRGKVLEISDLLGRVAEHRRQGRRIVFTNGCFDLLHIGHVTYLEEARQLGDVLIVAVNSDASVCQLKGPDRPVISQHDRAAVLAGLECIDYVTIFEELTPHRLLQVIRPDVLVKGGTYSADEVVGKEIVHSYGGHVEVLTCVDAISTTRILELCRTGNPGAPHENHPL